MPELSLSQAAKLTGKSKSTINRAVKSGKISATKHEDGSYAIDPAELARAFDLHPPDAHHGTAKEPDGTPEVELLRQRVADLEARLARELEIGADLKEDRDRWRAQASAILTPPSPRSPRRRWWPW